MTEHTPFRAMVAGLAAMGPVKLRGQEYKGEYLSTLVAINPETPAEEAARTSQLIAEIGRLTAAALKDKEMAEVAYRAWRSRTVTELTTDAEICENLDLVPEGSGKTLSKTAADEAIKQLDEYAEHYEAMKTAEEVHGVMYAAYEAAKARQWAIRAFEASGGTDTGRRTDNTPHDAGSENHYHGGHGGDATADMETRAAQTRRTPIPTPPPGPPPGPPGAPPPQPDAERKAAPPPPPAPPRS